MILSTIFYKIKKRNRSTAHKNYKITKHIMIYGITVMPTITVVSELSFQTECGIAPFTRKDSFSPISFFSSPSRSVASPLMTKNKWSCGCVCSDCGPPPFGSRYATDPSAMRPFISPNNYFAENRMCSGGVIKPSIMFYLVIILACFPKAVKEKRGVRAFPLCFLIPINAVLFVTRFTDSISFSGFLFWQKLF